MNPIALAGQYGWNPGPRQDGESFKAYFIRNAERFVDDWFFGGVHVSRLLYRMANYYLLEPERVHVCTMSAKEINLPVSQTKYAHLFDIRDSGDDFYFDNVTDYVRRVMEDIETLDFDETWKREIRLASRLIRFGSELCKVKLHPETSREEAHALSDEVDSMLPEFEDLWKKRNYEKGMEKFYTTLISRRDELRAL